MLAGAAALLIVSAGSGEFNGFHFADVSMRSWLGLAFPRRNRFAGWIRFVWLAVAKCSHLFSIHLSVRQSGSGGASRKLVCKRIIDAADSFGGSHYHRVGRFY